MNSLISFVSKLSFLWYLMLDFKGLLWNGQLIKELAPKQTTTMCSTQTHLIGITNTIITYVSWLPENPEEINGWLQFIPFQHFLLLPGFSGAARISSSVSVQIHWSLPNELSHISSSTPKAKAFLILSVDYPNHFFFPLCLVLVSYDYHFYVFISLLPFGHKHGHKEKQNNAVLQSFYINYLMPLPPDFSEEKSAPSGIEPGLRTSNIGVPWALLRHADTRPAAIVSPKYATAFGLTDFLMDFWSDYCFP